MIYMYIYVLAHLAKGNVSFCHHLASVVCRPSLFTFQSSPLKPLSQMNSNLVGSIYGRSSITIAHFVPIHLQTWPPQAILLSDWPILKRNKKTKTTMCIVLQTRRLITACLVRYWIVKIVFMFQHTNIKVILLKQILIYKCIYIFVYFFGL